MTKRKLYLISVIVIFAAAAGYLVVASSGNDKTFKQLKAECIERHKDDAKNGIIYKINPCNDDLIRSKLQEQ